LLDKKDTKEISASGSVSASAAKRGASLGDSIYLSE
jgi:hypothetical protein